MHDLLETILRKPHGNGAAGQAFNIRAVPDLFTGETLNIGVAVVAADGSRHVRVIEEPGRLECLYGKAAENVVFLARLAADAVLRGEAAPSPNIRFDAPTPYYHLDAAAALDTFFRDQVTVALPGREEEEGVDTANTDQVRAQVYDLLRQKGQPLVVDTIIPQSPQVVINTPRGPRSVRIPLQPEGAVGGIESAGYGANTVRMHLLDAMIDLDFAADYWQAQRTGLFIARPALPARMEARQRQIDNAIDYVVWRAPRTCRVEVETDLGVLAERILDWAQLKAA